MQVVNRVQSCKAFSPQKCKKFRPEIRSELSVSLFGVLAQNVYGNAAASKAVALGLAVHVQVNAVALDGSTGICCYCIAVAFDIQAG